jgi:hypothetical protein
MMNRGVEEHAEKILESTLSDCDKGYTLGPYYTADEVSQVVGSDRWVPTPRFPVVQKGKVRAVDGATLRSTQPPKSRRS